MEDGSRITEARRRLRSARLGVGIAAGLAFATLAFAARVAHPGTSAHASTGSQTSTTDSSSSSSFFDDSGPSFGSSQSASPQIESGGS